MQQTPDGVASSTAESMAVSSVSSVASGHAEIRPVATVVGDSVVIRSSTPDEVSGHVEQNVPNGVEFLPSVPVGVIGDNKEIRTSASVPVGVGGHNVKIRPSLPVVGGLEECRPGPSGLQMRPRLLWPSGVKSRKNLSGGHAPVGFRPPIMSRGAKILQLAQAARSKNASSRNESQGSSSVNDGSESTFYDEISYDDEELPSPVGTIVETTKTTVIVSNGDEVIAVMFFSRV